MNNRIGGSVRAGSDREQLVSSDLEALCAKGLYEGLRDYDTREGGRGRTCAKGRKELSSPLRQARVYIHRGRE